MTVEEKRGAVRNYCACMGCNKRCVLIGGYWEHKTKGASKCLNIAFASEEELDRALKLIGDAFYGVGEVLPVRGAEGIKSAVEVIQLEVTDGSALQLAHAICKQCVQAQSHAEYALIYLDELTEHIDAYVRAERKALEYRKLAEEG